VLLSDILKQPAVCIIFHTLRPKIILPTRLGIPGNLFSPDFPDNIVKCIFLSVFRCCRYHQREP